MAGIRVAAERQPRRTRHFSRHRRLTAVQNFNLICKPTDEVDRLTAEAHGWGKVRRRDTWSIATASTDSTTAECGWARGHLYVRSLGKRCGFGLVGVSFPGVESLAELPGQRWEPDDLSPSDDVFAEGGGVELQGRPFAIIAIRLSCTRYSAEAGTLSLEVWCEVEDEETGASGEVEGSIRCRVVEMGENGW